MIFANTRYIDPSIETNGDGLSPETAFNDIPSAENLEDDTLYIIKRTAGDYGVRQYGNLNSPTNMTKNEDDNWIITGTNQYVDSSNGWQLYGAFDGQSTYKKAFLVSGSSVPFNITWQTKGEPYVVRSYEFTSVCNNEDSTAFSFKQWKFEGSNDGTQWNTLDDKTVDRYPGKGEWFKANINNETPYTYYRILITGQIQNNSYTAIGEIKTYDAHFVGLDDIHYCTWPSFGSIRSDKTKIGFIGAPKESDQEYYSLPQEEKTKLTEAGWTSSQYDYANVRASGTNTINFAYSTLKYFKLKNINLERDCDSTNFDQNEATANSRCLIFFNCYVELSEIINCRFSAIGTFLDKEYYIHQSPSPKCCGYVYASSGGNFVIEGCVINFLTKSRENETHCYCCFRLSGGGENLTFSNNKVYFSQQNITSYIRSNNYDTDRMHGRNCLTVSENIWTVGKVNNNEFVFRCSDYSNMTGLMDFPYHDYFEFNNNYVHSGVHMWNYDFNRMLLRFHSRDMFLFSNSSVTYCCDYKITNNRIYLPELWNVYGGSIFYMHNANNTSANSSEGMYWSYGKRIFENFEIILGEGPSIDEINSDDKAIINTQRGRDYGFGGGRAFAFGGFCVWDGYGHYHNSNQANVLKGLRISHPWGIAIYIESAYAEADEIRGSVQVSNAGYINIKKMTVKAPYSNTIYNYAFGNIVIDELFIEDTTATSIVDSASTRFGIQINKQNIPCVSDNVWWANNGYYNESFIVQKDIGDSHKFKYRSLNRFIESCDAKRNGNNTLKIYGYKSRTENYPISIIGSNETGVSSRRLSPGKYIIRVHSAFYGADLVENTITTPSSNQKNVYKYYFTGIKTKWAYYNRVEKTTVENDGWEWSEILSQFYEEYFVDVYEESDVYLQLESFSVNSDNFEANNPTAAVFLDPNIEVIRIGDISDSSNSESYSGSISM